MEKDARFHLEKKRLSPCNIENALRSHRNRPIYCWNENCRKSQQKHKTARYLNNRFVNVFRITISLAVMRHNPTTQAYNRGALDPGTSSQRTRIHANTTVTIRSTFRSHLAKCYSRRKSSHVCWSIRVNGPTVGRTL